MNSTLRAWVFAIHKHGDAKNLCVNHVDGKQRSRRFEKLPTIKKNINVLRGTNCVRIFRCYPGCNGISTNDCILDGRGIKGISDSAQQLLDSFHGHESSFKIWN